MAVLIKFKKVNKLGIRLKLKLKKLLLQADLDTDHQTNQKT